MTEYITDITDKRHALLQKLVDEKAKAAHLANLVKATTLELAQNCQHEHTIETSSEGDNGYGRQWQDYYEQCLFCGYRKETRSTYGHWFKS